MFEIKVGEQGEIVTAGRLDASRIDEARSVLDAVDSSRTVDLAKLDYISSVGIGVFVSTQQRLQRDGHHLTLVNVNDRIKGVFRCAGLGQVFGME